MSMYQEIVLHSFSIFVDSSTAEYAASVDVSSCKQGTLTMIIGFYSEDWVRLAVRSASEFI